MQPYSQALHAINPLPNLKIENAVSVSFVIEVTVC